MVYNDRTSVCLSRNEYFRERNDERIEEKRSFYLYIDEFIYILGTEAERLKILY